LLVFFIINFTQLPATLYPPSVGSPLIVDVNPSSQQKYFYRLFTPHFQARCRDGRAWGRCQSISLAVEKPSPWF
jgi:hypothetical protein